MQITFKPLKGENFQVEANPEEKIGELKKKIAEAKPEYPADAQKLIFAGKILADDATIQDSGVTSEGFVVIMVAKAKPPPGSAAPAAAAATPAAPAAPAAAPAAAETPDAEAQAAAGLVAAAGMESTITQLCDMGFERPQVIRCLQAAFNNPDRAVEYLMSGIPAGAEAAAAQQGAPAGPPATGGGGGEGAFPAMPAGGGTPEPLPPALAELRNHPQFQQLAGAVAQNPQLLAQMLPAIAQTHPEIVQAIQAHPEAFMRMLQEAGAGGGGGGGGQDPRHANMVQLAAMLAQNPAMLEQILPEMLPEIEQNDPAAAAAIRENPQILLQMIQAAAAGGGMPGGPGGSPGAMQIQLTEEENAAVERLAALGFDKNNAAQAYLACDKNEEMAANFLFDNGGDD
mmetsp:Transcript_61361/g.99357  ORF Transcript_61361/g.99357 Transcript_61361/m.99357 type:complete len:399 (-) Transcript_61361:155-1351(-)